MGAVKFVLSFEVVSKDYNLKRSDLYSFLTNCLRRIIAFGPFSLLAFSEYAVSGNSFFVVHDKQWVLKTSQEELLQACAYKIYTRIVTDRYRFRSPPYIPSLRSGHFKP